LTIATAKDVEFKENVKDYDNIVGIGVQHIKGVVRNSMFNTLGLISGLAKDAFYEDNGSMMLITYSPPTYFNP